jgi:hypothetical protein
MLTGAILRHLVRANLELRLAGLTVIISHICSSTAGEQSERQGNFEIGFTVFHANQNPTSDHFRKAFANAESGACAFATKMAKIVKHDPPGYIRNLLYVAYFSWLRSGGECIYSQ